MNLSPDGGATPAPRREGNREAQYAAYRSRDGLPREDRHPADRLAPLPRAVPRHAQLAPVVRLAPADAELRRRRVEPGDLVHRGAAAGRVGAAVRPDAAGAARDGRVDARTSPRTRSASVAGNKPAGAVDSLLRDRRLAARAAATTSGTGSSTSGPKGACAQAFPPFATSRIVAGGPIEGGIFKCTLQPVGRGDRTGPVRVVAAGRGRASRGSSRSSRAGVCDYRRATRACRPSSPAGARTGDNDGRRGGVARALPLLQDVKFCCASVNSLTSAAARRIR